MKKILVYISLGLALAVLIGANFISYRLAHFRGRAEGWAEAECAATSRGLRQKAEVLRLIRSGETEAGLQLLDHTLDVDILIAAGRSPLCCARQLHLSTKALVHTLKPVAIYRANHARLPYTNDYVFKVEDEVDQLLKNVLKESPNQVLEDTAHKFADPQH